MVKVHLSPEAKNDLVQIKQYIQDQLQNPNAAKKTLTNLLKTMRTLERFPYAGTPLQVAGAETGYRTMTSGNYRIFYHGDEQEVYVVRVLYGRRDHMRALFGIAETDTTEE